MLVVGTVGELSNCRACMVEWPSYWVEWYSDCGLGKQAQGVLHIHAVDKDSCFNRDGGLELYDCWFAIVRCEQRNQHRHDWNRTSVSLSAQWRDLSWELVLTSTEGFMDESQHLMSHFCHRCQWPGLYLHLLQVLWRNCWLRQWTHTSHPFLWCRFLWSIVSKDNEFVHFTPHSVMALDSLYMQRIYKRRFPGQNSALMKTSTV